MNNKEARIRNNFLIILLGFFAIVSVSCFSISQAADDEDITISANTTWAAGTYNYRDVTITNNAVLTLSGSYTTDSDGAGVVVNARSINVNSGASITATGKGYAAQAGTGKGAISGMFGSGGSHGGKGGTSSTGTASGPVNGLVTNPDDLGSGGSSAAGGGAIILNLSGNLVAEGNITANGNNGGSYTGGGAGGTIKINAVDISGVGTINANGGNGGASGGGGGGGGRVAVYYTGINSKDNAKFTASGGTGANAGGVGSVWMYDKTNKDSTIFSTITLDPNEGVDVDGSPSTDGVYNFRNLTINNNATLYNKIKYSTDSDGTGIELKLTGDLNVAGGSKIDGIGLGYPIQTGEGKSPDSTGTVYGGGAGHGGNGGRGEGGSGGPGYDSTLFPVKPGSGGFTVKGGAGGSAIKISAVDIVVDGSIDQSAAVATGNGAQNGSGGAGGSIYIVASTVSGSGYIKANGSNGYGSSGGGGGGRIAIYSDTTGFSAGNISAAKGVKGGGGYSADGGVGTVFLYDTATGNVTASNDVSFEANQGVNRDGSIRTDGVFYFNNLTVTNNATVTVKGYYTNDSDGRGVTLNLDGQLTIDSGSKITATGQGYAGEIGPGKGTGTASTSGSGGSYGGLGGKSYNNNLASAIYDNTKANYPHALGSGGGAGTGIGGKGGGAITLRVLGDVTNNGEITADGSSGTGGVSGWRPGGGSGGSIFINCDSLSGSGTIAAKGGAGLGDANFGSGGGGGGRVSIVYKTAQNMSLSNFSIAGGSGGGGVTDRAGADGSVNITQRVLPAAEFTLKNPNNNSSQFTNTENVEIVPNDEAVKKYKDAASANELVPTFYAEGWNNVADGKDVGASEGTKTVRAWFKDDNELISSSIGTATITLDKTKPTVAIANNNQTFDGATATIQLNLADNLSGIDYITINGQKVDITLQSSGPVAHGSSIKAYAADSVYETTVPLSAGENSIPIVIYDKAGNSTETTFVATRAAGATLTPTAVASQISLSPTTISSSVATNTAAALQIETSPSTYATATKVAESVSSTLESVGNSISNIFSPDSQSLHDKAEDQRSTEMPNNRARIWIESILAVIGAAGIWVILGRFRR